MSDPSVWLLIIPPMLLAIIVHEVAHGWTAKKLGDPTAHMMGRLTLNPLAHIDPVGTIILPLVQILISGRVFFAWAKPVPVNMSKLRKPLQHFGVVAVAGPVSNLIQATLWAGAVWLLASLNLAAGGMAEALLKMSVIAIQINLGLMAFNMLPIPPLDGSRIVAAFLPAQSALQFLRTERWSFLVLMGILYFAPGLLHRFIDPVVDLFMRLLLPGY